MHVTSRCVLQETVREAGDMGGREVPACVMSVRILVSLLSFYTHARKTRIPIVLLSFVVMLPARHARPPDLHLLIHQHVPPLHMSCCRP